MAIDVGPGAIDRVSSVTPYTLVSQENAANADGTLETWELWAYTDLSGCEVATFYVVSGNSLSTRDYEIIGSVSSGSKQIFTGLATDVQTGDYAGVYFSGGNIEFQTSGGGGIWYAGGDNIPCTENTFGALTGRAISVYATGTEGGGGAEEKTSTETGAGVESVSGRGLAGGETCSGIEAALAGAAVLASDTGQGGEFAHILGLWEVLFSGDAGRGADSLKALTILAGHDMKMQTGYGRVGLPHKEVNL